MRCSKCNEKEHQANARFCHMCGFKLDFERDFVFRKLLVSVKGFRWVKVFRYLLLVFILIEYIFISLNEINITDADGNQGFAIVAIYCNFSFFLFTLFLCYAANSGDFDDETRGLRFYYEWLHFFTVDQMPILIFLILSNIQNGWALLLDFILVAVGLLATLGIKFFL